MLRLRLAEGLPLETLAAGRGRRPPQHSATGCWAAALAGGRAVLTLRGRLLADGVIRDLLVRRSRGGPRRVVTTGAHGHRRRTSPGGRWPGSGRAGPRSP